MSGLTLTSVGTAADAAPHTRTATGEGAGDWLCAWCLSQVADERYRIQREGRGEFTFTNPAGFRFDILTFGEAPGCETSGDPSLEHTWFPGYAWCYCHCRQCGQHLGWHYSGEGEFFGLIKGRIVRGLQVRN